MQNHGNNKEKQAICGICPAGCWVVVEYDHNGMIGAVRADGSSTLGMICRLGEHSREIVYSKDRLKYPLKRNGPKGSFDFERISWDEAYDIIVSRHVSIKAEYGPEATAIYTGRGSFELAMCDVYQPKGVAVSSASSVLFPFGSPNTLGVGALCYVSFAMIAPHVTMGGMMINMFSDIENAQLIVVWGANPATDSPPLDYKRIIAASNRGAEIVVIDPRKTMMAKLPRATWIPIRPGTDGALALSMCGVIIEEELYDEDFVRNWSVGFDDFTRYVQHFRPETVESVTGIDAQTIRQLARKIAGASGSAPIMYSGLEYSDSGVQAIRAAHVLWALAGQLDVSGGRCFTMAENHFKLNRDGLIQNPDMTKALGKDRFPVYSHYRGESHAIALCDSVINSKPYKIRSLIVLGGSIITAWPEPHIWRKTLNNLDFLVTIDRTLTADAAYADIVLPATTMYEIESYMVYGPMFVIRERVIEPLGQARNDFFIMAELAARLGYGHLYPQTEDELFRYVLKGTGFTLQDIRDSGGTVSVKTVMPQYKKWQKGLLRPDGRPGFDTPSGKFEIASSILEEYGYDPLPVYTEPAEGPLAAAPEVYKRYPLIFNSGARVTTDFRSQHHGIESLLRDRPHPTVTINTLDARQRGITTGDSVTITTARGAVTMRAIVTDDIIRGAIDANMGGGGPVGPKSWQDCNINDLTSLERYDPISGFPVYKTLLCQVAKADSENSDTFNIGSGEYAITAHDSSEWQSTNRVYLDHNATTPVHENVREAMNQTTAYGNPSSIYGEGRQGRAVIDTARRAVAQLINCTAKRLIFTSGGSEANNMAIKGVIFSKTIFNSNKRHLITSSIEHPSVLKTFQNLEQFGFNVTYLNVDKYGTVDVDDLKAALTETTALVSIMMANNETGSIQPIKALAAAAKQSGAVFHTDAVQAIGKIPVDVEALGVDMLSLSGHKFYAPKAVGALYIRKGINVQPLIDGGGQEWGLRAGTENLHGIAAIGQAALLAVQLSAHAQGILALCDKLQQGICRIIPDARLNGHQLQRLPNTLNMTLPGMRGESVVLALDQKGIAISSGSAGRSGSPEPSHALTAMGLSQEDAHCSVRFSLGYENTHEQIEHTIRMIGEMVRDVKNLVRFVPCR